MDYGALISALAAQKSPMQTFMEEMHKGNLDRYRAAETKKEENRANLPFGGIIPPGPAGQTVGLEMVKGLYGEDSPQYQQAKSQFDLNKKSAESRANYQDILANSAEKRFSTPLAKTAMEFQDIKDGFYPGTKKSISDEDKQKYAGLYGLKFIKETTDADTRKRNLFAHNMDITIGQIDPKALTQYSGLEGATNLLKDRANSLKGIKVPRYLAYEKALTQARTLAKQYRQYAGDSITPGVQKDLKELTNPTSWLINPQIALEKYNTFVNLLKSETGTYQQATQNPDIYSGNAPIPVNTQSADTQESGSIQGGSYSPETLRSQPDAQAEGISIAPPLAVPAGKIIIIDSNGDEATIDENKFDEAKKIDPGVRRKGANNAAP